MHTTGSCFCGAIHWEAEIDPNMVAVCHCTDCQVFSGSAFRMSGGDPKGFTFTKGAPRIFEKTADSGRVRRMAFCGDCGTHLASVPTEDEQEMTSIAIRLATCKDFDKLKPMAEIYCDSKVAWQPEIDGTVKFPRDPQLP